jgi:hypothetical protein
MKSQKLTKLFNSFKSFPIPKKYPLSLVFGALVISIYWIFIIISASFFVGLNPFVNWMSNLGNTSMNPNGAIYFNLGCIIAGFLLFPFFIGLYEWYIGSKKNKNLTIGTQIAGFFSAFSLIMIGVFSEDTFILHIIWATTLFSVNNLTLILPAIALYQFNFTRNIAKFAIIATIVNITYILTTWPIIEWATIFMSFGFIAVLIHNMRKRLDKFRFARKSGIELLSKKQREKRRQAKRKAKANTK